MERPSEAKSVKLPQTQSPQSGRSRSEGVLPRFTYGLLFRASSRGIFEGRESTPCPNSTALSNQLPIQPVTNSTSELRTLIGRDFVKTFTNPVDYCRSLRRFVIVQFSFFVWKCDKGFYCKALRNSNRIDLRSLQSPMNRIGRRMGAHE